MHENHRSASIIMTLREDGELWRVGDKILEEFSGKRRLRGCALKADTGQREWFE